MKCGVLEIAFVITILSPLANCGDILFIIVLAYSFIPPLLSIAESLRGHGHRSTFILSDSLAKVPILKDKPIDIVISDAMSKFRLKDKINSHAQAAFRREGMLKFKLRDIYADLCNQVLEDDNLFKDLKKRKFDLAVVSKHPIAICFNIVAYKLSLPFVHVGIGYDVVNDRLPYLPSFVTDIFFLGYSNKRTVREKIVSAIFYMYRQLYPDIISQRNAIAKYAPEKPFMTTNDLWLQCKFHLIDSDILLDYPRPIFPNYAFVAGLSVCNDCKLPKDFSQFTKKSKHGIIVISFGTLIDTFPIDILQKFTKVFMTLRNYDFIIKLGYQQSINMPNVLQRSWIPQSDLLADPNTKLFITHCGHNSQVEAVYHGVPMIMFPVILDQHYNAGRIESKGYGITMDITDFEADDLILNIINIFENKKYSYAVKNASVIFKSRKEAPQDVASYWIDHVMKYGGDYLRPTSIDIPFFEYYLLDIFSIFVFVGLIFLVIVWMCIRYLSLCIPISKPKTD